MRVMVMVKATRQSEAGEMPDVEMLTAMGSFNEALVKAGIMLAGEGLHPSVRGHRVSFTQRGPQLATGPFAPVADVVSGFWLWQVRSMEEALEWAKRAPFPPGTGNQLELRPVFEAADFGEALTPELREQEARLRDQAGRA